HPLLINSIVDTIPFDGYLTSNGQYCYTDREVVLRTTIPQTDKEAMVELLKEEDIPLMFLTENGLYLNKKDGRVEQGMALLDMPLFDIKDPAVSLEQDIFALLLFGENTPAEQKLLEQMPGSKAVRWTPIFADIIPKVGGKETGMDAMLAHFGIPIEETMAVGDAHNDIGMLRHAATGVVMGGAADEVKAAADYVTDTVEEDGIYNALKYFGVI
ncbi:MAG: HAD hydrolase family protein, partial [Oscillospiraceae bacterium]|nr:HAD hydrolase family protein [Oscillospiraceae bacterium]